MAITLRTLDFLEWLFLVLFSSEESDLSSTLYPEPSYLHEIPIQGVHSDEKKHDEYVDSECSLTEGSIFLKTSSSISILGLSFISS